MTGGRDAWSAVRDCTAALCVGVAIALGCAASAVAAEPQSLEQLLDGVLGARQAAATANAEREQHFIAERDAQQARVVEARARLAAEQHRSDELRALFAARQQAFDNAGTALAETAGDIEDIQAVVKQAATELESTLRASMISAEYPARTATVSAIAQQQEFPAYASLEDLWHLQLQEAVETGNVVRFTAKVVNGEGTTQDLPVTRAGPFTATTGGRFLRYLPESGTLLLPTRQPEGEVTRLAAGLDDPTGGLVPVPIDPTRGALLAVLGKTPGFAARLHQAGGVGYFILLLGALAAGVIGERFWRLHRTLRAIRRQAAADIPNGNNPLGRLRLVARAHPNVDTETLGLRLDDAMLGELPALRRWLPMLAVLAAAAPLCGLLGTVIGMIQTFQSMTLFGAGDPKIVSGGISLALVATELGLAVAIPVLLAHAWLQSLSNQVVHRLEQEVAALIAHRETHEHAAAVRSR
jgi:biopolymer transport protein ExbB